MSVEASEHDAFTQRVRWLAQLALESRSAAIAGLYDLTANRLLRLATSITRSQHDAEDALQSSLARVAQSPDVLLRASQPWHYLLKMVRNDALLILRRKRSMLRLSNDDLITQCPVDQLERAETYYAVWVALRKLPAEQSEVVVLKIWEELTFRQIASILDLPLPTVASRYRYGLEKLADYLQSEQRQVQHG